jgi:hypothetical protein
VKIAADQNFRSGRDKLNVRRRNISIDIDQRPCGNNHPGDIGKNTEYKPSAVGKLLNFTVWAFEGRIGTAVASGTPMIPTASTWPFQPTALSAGPIRRMDNSVAVSAVTPPLPRFFPRVMRVALPTGPTANTFALEAGNKPIERLFRTSRNTPESVGCRTVPSGQHVRRPRFASETPPVVKAILNAAISDLANADVFDGAAGGFAQARDQFCSAQRYFTILPSIIF